MADQALYSNGAIPTGASAVAIRTSGGPDSVLNIGQDNIGIGTTSPSAQTHLKGKLNVALTGTVSVTIGTASVTGSGTSFTTELKVGNAIKIANEIFTVKTITSNTALTLDSNHSAGASVITAYKDGDLFTVQNGDGTDLLKIDKTGVDLKMIGPWVDVRAFGAKGDGSSDDTTAIQAAIDSLVNSSKIGVVYFPTGTYKITSTLLIGQGQVSGSGNKETGSGIVLLGASPKGSVLIANRNNGSEPLAGSNAGFYSKTTYLTTYTIAEGQILPQVGDLVHVAGFTETRFNGDFSVLAASSSTFIVYNPNFAEQGTDDVSELYTNQTYTRNMHILQICGGQVDTADYATECVLVKHLGFQLANSQHDKHIVINIQLGAKCIFESIDIQGGGVSNRFLEGFRIQCWCNVIKDSAIDYCTTALRLQGSVLITNTLRASNNNTIMGAMVRCFGKGVVVNGGTLGGMKCYGNAIIGCTFEAEDTSSGHEGVDLDAHSSATYVYGCYFERNNKHIYIASDYNAVIGNFMTTGDSFPGISFNTGNEVGNTILGNFIASASPYQRNFLDGPLGIGTKNPARGVDIAGGTSNTDDWFGLGIGDGYADFAIIPVNRSNNVYGGAVKHSFICTIGNSGAGTRRGTIAFKAEDGNTSPYTRAFLVFSSSADLNMAQAGIDSNAEMVITEGKVGVGTIPSSAFEVYPDVAGKGAKIGRAALGDWNAFGQTADYAVFGHVDQVGSSSGYGYLQSADGTSIVNSASGQPLYLAIAGAEKLTVNSSGRIGVNETSPSEQLTVNGNIKVEGAGNGLILPQLSSAPTSPSDGMIAYANGTTWNPGSQGKGMYYYNEASTTWVKLG